MKRYRSSVPRVACGFGAVAMTAVTLAMFVVFPVHLASAGRDAGAQTEAVADAKPPIEVVITASPIDVVGVHDVQMALKPASSHVPKHRQQG